MAFFKDKKNIYVKILNMNYKTFKKELQIEKFKNRIDI